MVSLTSEPLGGGWAGDGFCSVSFPDSFGHWARCQGIVYEALYGPEETNGIVVGLCEKCYRAAEELAASRFVLAAKEYPDWRYPNGSRPTCVGEISYAIPYGPRPGSNGSRSTSWE